MPPLVINGGLLAICRGQAAGSDWVNVVGLGTPSNDPLDQEIATDIGIAVAHIYGELTASLSNSFSMDEILIQDLRSSTAPTFDTGHGQITGTDVGNELPPHIAICSTHRTALRGRSYRGRTYLAGYTVSNMTAEGRVTTALCDVIDAAWETMRDELALITGMTVFHAVVSRTLEVVTPVVSTVTNNEFDHQDRRKRGS